MQVSKTFELEVTAALEIVTQSLPMAHVGEAYSFQLEAAGGILPYVWAASDLPEGLSLSSEGLLSGTPSTASKSTPTVTVTDSRPE